GLILALSPAPTDNSDVQEPSQALSAYFPLIKDFCTTKGSSFCLAVQPSPQPDLRAEQPVLAGLTGFFLAAALEYPACLFRTVSLGDKAPPHWLAQTLTPATPALPRPVQWLCADNACRSLQLHAQALDPALALCAESSRGQGLPLRRGDILVVPGGARGISPYALSSLAPWACTFVLLGRKAAPASSAESAALTRLRALGGTVEHLVCDVNDAEAVNRTLLDIKQRLGRIDGIIYTAGITRDATLDKMDRATFDTVVQTKCQGLWHCLEAARPAGLRYAVVFSSIAAWLGNYAQANYCAANRAMTAFVHRYARAHGLVSRGLWLPPICGAGMAASAEIQEQMRARGLEHACVHCEELGDLFARELFCGAAPDCLWARVLPAVPHVSAAAALSHRAMVGQFERPEAFPLVFPINAYAALTGLGTAPAGTCFTGGHNFSRYSPTMTTWNTPAASTPPLSTVSAGMLLACLMETAAQNCPWLTVTSIRNFTLTRPLAVYGGLTRETRITSLVLPWNLNSARITRICTTDMHVHTLADNGRKQAGLRPVCHGESVLEAQALVVPSLKDSSLISALASPDCVYEIIPAMPVCTTKTLFYGQILDACFDIALRICSRESKAEVTIKSIDEIVFSSQNIKVSQDMQVCLRASTRPSQTAVHFDGEITDKQGNVYSILHNIIFDEQAS
ncbi:MAG: SDR family NAD(P)-dependent oxidoreductase, partial [Desulfovibrionaceae bacterium]